MKTRVLIVYTTLLLTTAFVFADRIVLSSGKEITGKIISFTTTSGLVVQTEYGHITIKPGNLVSFEINDDYSSTISDRTTLQNSRFFQNGMTLDTAKLSSFNLSYDVNHSGHEHFLVYGSTVNQATHFLINAEHLGMPNEDYYNLVIKMQKAAMQYSIDGEEKRKEINGFDFILKEYSGRYSGLDLTYVTGIFKHDDINYRILAWTFSSIYERGKEEIWDIFRSVQVRDDL
ncbi:hypothetical protein CHISP_1495 [Chitinispirillum alkaliphilum]|nr:hypothetical protein CHISP_1495 [Chitinispirillum alkaliphilum]